MSGSFPVRLAKRQSRSRSLLLRANRGRQRVQAFSASRTSRKTDPRVQDLGRQIYDDYARIRDKYTTPKYPLVLAHGLLGFSELRVSPVFPTVQYWYGIKDALVANGSTVITTSVPPSASIEDRAARLATDIAEQQQALAQTKSQDNVNGLQGYHHESSTTEDELSPPVNIIAHSMGGLDARYMISRLGNPSVRIASLTTIATPHHGSPVADYLVTPGASPIYLPKLYGIMSHFGLGTSAFEQLTTTYMEHDFNPSTPDDPAVRYFSYGADMLNTPGLFNAFRRSYTIIHDVEGANDGLVSVDSSRWGEYQGTLLGVSHLDLINWPNRVRWAFREWMGMKRTFNAIAFYLGIADMLAKKGL